MVENQSSFTISKWLDAPRERVWSAWMEREQLMQWFGPSGFTMSIAAFDPTPGGIFLYGMKTLGGGTMWGKWTFKEIAKPERLVVIVSFSDEHAGMTRHPFVSSWPLETISTTTFTEQNGKTLLSLNWSPYHATEAEQKTFDAAHSSMQEGWTGTMSQLEAFLAT